MQKSDLPLHQMIKSPTAQPSSEVADAAIGLWELLSIQIISIIGEGGFNSLYARSLFLTQSTYPWLATDALSSQTVQRFAELRISFEAQTPELTSAANSQLLFTFTDILASLIGEQLTTRILSSAWSNLAQDRISKEFKNE